MRWGLPAAKSKSGGIVRMRSGLFRDLADQARGSPGGAAAKNLPAVQEMWVQSLGWEVPLEKEMATHSRILAWKIPWREPGGPQSMGSQSRIQLSTHAGQVSSSPRMPFITTKQILKGPKGNNFLKSFLFPVRAYFPANLRAAQGNS